MREEFPLSSTRREALRKELKSLLAEKALALRQVKLASGKLSDYYLDCKTVTLHSRGLYLCGALLYDRLLGSEVPQGAGGPTLGADPLTAAIILQAEENEHELHGFIVRKETKEHGTQRWLEGCETLPKGATVALIEDVVTTAGSSLKAIEKIAAGGYVVRRVLCLVDREEGGKEALAKAGYRLEALFTANEIRNVKK